MDAADERVLHPSSKDRSLGHSAGPQGECKYLLTLCSLPRLYLCREWVPYQSSPGVHTVLSGEVQTQWALASASS